MDYAFGYLIFSFYQLFIFLVMLNIFIAILNDAYLAIKIEFDGQEVEKGPPPLSLSQRIKAGQAWLRQLQFDRRIEHLRKEQRVRELHQKREMHKMETLRNMHLRSMGVDVEAEEVRRKAKMAEHANELSTEVII